MAESLKILLASDFSARSDRPLERALLLAREWQAKLVIAHVLENKDAGKLDLNDGDIIETLRAELPEAASDAELVVRLGAAPQVLAEAATESGSDLIVTGVARFNSIGDFFLGTAVDHIVRNADVPVLVVRKRPLEHYKALLVATDFSDCSRDALLTAARLFPDAVLTLVHAFHVPYGAWLKSESVREEVVSEEQERLDDFLAHPAITADIRDRLTSLIDEGELGAVIERQLKESGADLLVLGTHGRSGFTHATIGSNAETLLSSANCDVIMVRKLPG